MKYLLILVLLLAIGSVSAQDDASVFEQLIVPDGFEISAYVNYSHEPRSMILGEQGALFVGTRTLGAQLVYAYVDRDNDGVAETEYIIDAGLEAPNGIEFNDGSLYVITTQRVLRYDNIENRLDNPPEPMIVYDGLPDEPHHGWRYAAFGPDERLYIGIGAPCNICEFDPDVFGVMLSMTADGGDVRIEAHGIRHTVGFDFHPETHELWFTDNGRDWISDDLPPDELNRISAPDLNFGFPYCHGGFLADTDFPRENACEGTVAPEFDFPAHVAPLGMAFYTGDTFPETYHNQLFVAEHGSRNRSSPVGYRVSVVYLAENGEVIGYEPFVGGFLQGQYDYEASGRPVDVLVMPDGSLLISDDWADVIYRVRYIG